MEVLDTTIANVVLPYIAGGMGVSSDEASWVVTSYLVSNAISLTASPFLARLFGRKTFFLICLGLFSVSSILCAQAWNLNSLLLFRILQGLAGGGMVPVSQSILADAFPPQKRGQAFALFGVAVVVAPVVGPTLGGWLADNYTWRWCFLINGPVGLATIALIAVLLPADKPNPAKQARFDVIGFLLVATFLGALEVVLDRGLEDDWFGSSFIVTFTVICALAFVLMIPWELSRKDPMIDMRMVGSRQFGACFLVMGATGAILYATTQFLPLMVQTEFGYTATWAGLVLSPGGLVTMVMMFIVGQVSGRIQPKYLIMTGAIFAAISMYQLTNVYADLDFWTLAQNPHGAWRRLAAHLYPNHRRLLRRDPAKQGGHGVGADQRGAQHRRLDRRLDRFQRAHASRAVPSEPAHRAHHPVEPAISEHAAAGDALFRLAGLLAERRAGAGDRLDRPAGAEPIRLSILRGRVLGADAALARRRSAGDEPAQGQARRGSGARGALAFCKWPPVRRRRIILGRRLYTF